MIEPNLTAAVEFMEMIHPGRTRVLVAINPLAPPGKEEIAAKELHPDNHEGVVNFVKRAYEKRWNCYYTVNVVGQFHGKKPRREHFSQIPYLHVDVDPRKPDAADRENIDAFLAKEQERILKLLTSQPGGIPLPTVLVKSGGGYNALWRLAEPLEIVGADDKARLASADAWKHYNRQLERSFGGDNCHNIDRVLRVPGSVNWPNHVKIKAGRTEPTLAELIAYHQDRVYPIGSFTPAPLTREQTSGPPPRITLPSGPLQRVKDLDTLDLSKIPKTADLVRRVIADGRDTQDTTRFCDQGGKFDRSRAVYFVTCQLAAAGIGPDQVYAIITDPRFAISESIREKGSSLERHALRAVERGVEAAISPELAELNDEHAVISSLGGKCVVVQEEQDPTGKIGRSRLTVSTFEDIAKRYSNRTVLIGSKTKRGGAEEPVYQKLGQFWLDHPQRNQYKGLIFAPGREVPGYYNLWQGFAVEAIEGDCSLFLKHIHDVVCSGKDEYYEYLLNWMAFAVQHPDDPAEVAVVFRGEQGAGKGVVARELGKLFGRHFLQVINSSHLTGQFNDHLRDCVLLFLDEALFAADPRQKNIMKGLITEEHMMVEKKGVDATLSRNHLHIMIAGNDDWVVPAEAKERRYFVLDVPSLRRGKEFFDDYWTPLYRQMDAGGREALLYFLLNRDITKYAPRAYPETTALAEQKMRSLTSLQEWWLSRLNAGSITAHHPHWRAPIVCERLQREYQEYAGRLRGRIASATEIGKFLAKYAPGTVAKKEQFLETTERGQVKTRMRAYFLPPLETCREVWDREFGMLSTWAEIEAEPDTDARPIDNETIPF